MSNLARGILKVASGVCFLVGALYLPFGVWASGGQGANPVLGWVIYLSSVLVPWAIGAWLARISFRGE